MTGWFLGTALSGLALPGVALAGAFPAIAPAAVDERRSVRGRSAARNDRGPPCAVHTPLLPLRRAPVAPRRRSLVPLTVRRHPTTPPYPAPPPGYYGYPPPGYPPPSYFAAQRLAVLDAQIRDLQTRREDIGLTLPLVLLIGGGALGIAGLVVIGANTCSTDQLRQPTGSHVRGEQ